MSSKIFLAYEYSDLHLFINNHSSPSPPARDVFFLPKFHFITFKVKLVVPRFVPSTFLGGNKDLLRTKTITRTILTTSKKYSRYHDG